MKLILNAFCCIENDFHLSIQSPSGEYLSIDGTDGRMRSHSVDVMYKREKIKYTKDEEPVLRSDGEIRKKQEKREGRRERWKEKGILFNLQGH